MERDNESLLMKFCHLAVFLFIFYWVGKLIFISGKMVFGYVFSKTFVTHAKWALIVGSGVFLVVSAPSVGVQGTLWLIGLFLIMAGVIWGCVKAGPLGWIALLLLICYFIH